jgi:hypothetical protein
MKKYSQFVDESISFKINDQLNPKFWNRDKLKPEVSKHLKKIADAWADFVGLKKSDVQDILLLGGNAGYNYTKYSDLDLHIVVDIENTIDCPDLASEYYEDKKQLWKLTHSAKIYGHDVEPYVEDVGKKRRKNQGVYSIKYKKWIVLPGKFTGEVDKDLLESKVRDMMVKIDRIVRSATNEQVLTELLSKIRDMRNAGLDKSGEFSFENLVFKELRNKGYIDKLADHIIKLQDKSLTLENYVN